MEIRTLDSQVTLKCYKDHHSATKSCHHNSTFNLSFRESKLRAIAQPFIPFQNTNVDHWQKQSWYTFMLLIKGKCGSSTGTSIEIPPLFFLLWELPSGRGSCSGRMTGNGTWPVLDSNGRWGKKRKRAVNKLGTEYGSSYMWMKVSMCGCVWERDVCLHMHMCVSYPHLPQWCVRMIKYRMLAPKWFHQLSSFLWEICSDRTALPGCCHHNECQCRKNNHHSKKTSKQSKRLPWENCMVEEYKERIRRLNCFCGNLKAIPSLSTQVPYHLTI